MKALVVLAVLALWLIWNGTFCAPLLDETRDPLDRLFTRGVIFKLHKRGRKLFAQLVIFRTRPNNAGRLTPL